MRGSGKRVLVSVFVYNEGAKFVDLLTEFPSERDYDLLVVNDGSTDGIEGHIAGDRFQVITNERNMGLGFSFKRAVRYALDAGYDIFIPIAGNGKMRPAEIPGVLKPILEDGFDYVQGSRYLAGGRKDNLPLFRDVMITLLSAILSIVTGRKVTDSTCGFRAYRLDMLRDPRINIWQDWLDKYELENYLNYKALTLDYRMKEVPVSMIYPVEGRNYSKIQPVRGWWSMVKPFVLLFLNIRH